MVEHVSRLASPGDKLNVEHPIKVVEDRVAKSEDFRPEVAAREEFRQEANTRPQRVFSDVALEHLTQEWMGKMERLAPGVMKSYRLEVKTFEALRQKLESQQNAKRVPGDAQAAIDSHNRLFYLVAEHLMNNSSDVSLLNVQHEMSHAFQRTLTIPELRDLQGMWREEMRTKTGPLFENGALRKNVALGVDSNFGEWFAERMAWANHKWAKNRIEPDPNYVETPASQPPGLRPEAGFIEKAAYQFRQMIKGMSRILNRRMTNEELLQGFRQFLDQGPRWRQMQREQIEFVDRGDSGWNQLIERIRNHDIERNTLINLGETPEALKLANAPDLPLYVSSSVLEKAEDYRHGINLAEMGNPAKLLRRPLLIVDNPSPTGVSDILAFVDAFHEGKPIVAAIEFNTNEARLQVNKIRSMYPKDRFAQDLERWIQNDSIRYVDKKRSQERLGELAPRQLREVTNLIDSNKNIRTEADLRQGPDVAFAEREPQNELQQLVQRIKNYEKILSKINDDINANSGSHRELNPRKTLDDLRKEQKFILQDLAELRAKRDDLVVQVGKPAAEAAAAATEEIPKGARVVRGPRTKIPDADGVEPGYSERFNAVLGDTHQKDPIGQAWKKIKGAFTGFISPLPELPVFGKSKSGLAPKDFAMFREGYRLLKGATAAVQKDAEIGLRHILEPINTPGARMDNSAYNLFRKVLIARDLYYRSQLTAPGGTVDAEGNPRRLQLPKGLTHEEAKAAVLQAHADLAAHPQRDSIEEALRRHYEFVRTEVADLADRGYIIPDELRNPFYYPHKILEYWNGRVPSVATSPSDAFRGYLQPLVGSQKDIEADYVKAMYAHMVEVMSDNARIDLVDDYWSRYDVKDALKRQAADYEQEAGVFASPTRYKAFIPDGYKEVQIDKRILLRGEYVVDRQKLADRMGIDLADNPDFKQLLRDAGIKLTADDVRQALMAGEQRTWVVPEEIADALTNLVARERGARKEGFTGAITTVLGKLQQFWKWNTLFNPVHVFRYSFNNTLSDFEKIWTADPGMAKQLLPAYREVMKFYSGKEKGFPSKNFEEAFKRSVMESVTAMEIGNITKLKGFENFRTTAEVYKGLLGKLVNWGLHFNKVRENTFRYAKYLADIDRLKNGAEPEYAGARRDDIKDLMAHNRLEDAAANIARNTFVDYGAISPNGDQMRRYISPFFSWTEGNMRYHANLLRNYLDIAQERERLPDLLGRTGGLVASKIIFPKSLMGFALRLALPWAAVQIWNTQMMGDEEKDLSEEDKRRFHITLGRDEHGRVRVIYTPTAFSDVLEWFGGNEFARTGMAFLTGQSTLEQSVQEFARNWPKQILNKVMGQVGPTFKVPYEILSHKSTFPDILDQRSIPDYAMKSHILGQMVGAPLADVIMRVADKDYYRAKDLPTWIQQMVFQTRLRDPQQWSYFSIRDKVQEFNQAQGKNNQPGTSENEITPIAAAFRRSIYQGDVSNAMRFYNRLVELGYTSEQFASMTRNQDPLSGLSKDQRQAFINQLAPNEQRQLRQAYDYYAHVAALGDESKDLFQKRNARVPTELSPETLSTVIQQGQGMSPGMLHRVEQELLRRSINKHITKRKLSAVMDDDEE